jgi:hypothetical protein
MALFAQQREHAEQDERRERDEQIERKSHRVFLLSGQSEGLGAQGMSQGPFDFVCLYKTLLMYIFVFL